MKRWLLQLVVVLLIGCAGKTPPVLPKQALSVPLVRQATNYSCGTAALLAVLFYWRVFSGREDQLYPLLGTTEDGTPPTKIAEVARSFGLEASVRENLDLADLKAALARGETAIVSLQAWHGPKEPGFDWRQVWEDGHYVVLIGIDSRYAYFMDPSSAGAYAFVPLGELVERWHDYTAIVDGKRVPFEQAAIVIKGSDRMRTVPGPLVRME